MCSEPRICFRENQNKEQELFFKVALSGKFFCNASSWRGKNFRELDHRLSLTEAATEMFLENTRMLYDTQIIPLKYSSFMEFLSSKFPSCLFERFWKS